MKARVSGMAIRHLLVPGRGIPRPEHWLRRWADARPGYRWAPEPPAPPLVLRDRVAALDRTIRESEEPAILIAHSAGCVTVAVWAAGHRGPVRAALLVTPPDIEGARPDDPSDLPWVLPRTRLPFRAVLVGSRTDPYSTFDRFEQLAVDWGARLVDAGDAGHLDTSSGYGPWPDGERLVEELTRAP
jgi:predicted alpha/beta hydrolase family esterase